MDQSVLEIILRAKDEASAVIDRATKNLKANFDEAESASKKFGLGLLGVGTAAAGLIGYGAKIAGDLEASRQGFITLLGSTDKANAAIEQIKKDAAATPFELPGLVSANQLLTSVTKDAGKSESLLLNVGKALAAMGKGQPELDRIIVNLQQIGAVGHASLLDIKQFAFAGIPIFDMLTQATGKSGEALSQMISSGGVTFDLLTQMFNKAGGAGGQFADAFKNQAGTFNQLVSNMHDSFNIFLADTLQRTGIFDMLKTGMTGLIDFMNQHGKDIGNGIIQLMTFLKHDGPVVAGVIIGGLTPAMIGFAMAVGAATLALAPYLAAGLVIGLLAKVIIDHWKPISSFFTNLWSTITKSVQNTSRAISENFHSAVSTVQTFFRILGDFFSGGDPTLKSSETMFIPFVRSLLSLRDGITDFMEGTSTAIKNAITGTIIFFQRLPGAVSTFFYALFFTTIPYTVGFAIGYLTESIPRLVNDVILWFQRLPSEIATTMAQVYTAITQRITDTAAWLAVTIPQLATSFGVWLAGIPGVVAGIFLAVGAAIVTRITSVWNWLTSTLTAWGKAIGKFISDIPSIIGNIFGAAKDGALGEMDNLWKGLKDIWDKIKGIFDAIVHAAGDAGKAVEQGIKAGGKVGVQAFAGGTSFAPGGLALVGERGPELVNLPRGSQVIPNSETQNILNNQKSITLNNYFSTDVNADSVIRQLSYALRFDSTI